MKPHTAISAIYQPVLRQKLEQQGVVFSADDFIEPREFLSELCVTGATHAIAHISVFEPRHRKELQTVRKANPRVCIIVIVSAGTLKDKKLMDVFAEFNVRVVADRSTNLVDSIAAIIEETAEPDSTPEWTEAVGTAEPEKAPELVPMPLPPAGRPAKLKLPKIKAPDKPPIVPPARPEASTGSPVTVPAKDENSPAAAPTPQLPEQPPGPQIIEPRPEPAPRPQGKQKKPRLPRPTVPVVIPIFGGSRGAGCTWLTVQIGYYIAQQGHAVAVCGASDLLLMGPRYVRAGDTRFSVKDVDIYPYHKPPDLISAGYDYIVFDASLVMDFEPDGTPFQSAPASDMQEIMRAPCKVMVTDVGLWRQTALMQLLTNRVWQQLAQTSSIAASCRASGSAVSALERQYRRMIVRLPVAEPFELTAEVVSAVESLLQQLFK